MLNLKTRELIPHDPNFFTTTCLPLDYDANAPELVKQYVRFGGSPRGAQSMLLAARIRCSVDGRLAPSIDDVRAVALPSLRHRVLLNFQGEADGIDVDDCLRQVLKTVPTD